jgi:hypothetical protein
MTRSSRAPETPDGGAAITTVVGCLGTDTVTRHLSALPHGQGPKTAGTRHHGV